MTAPEIKFVDGLEEGREKGRGSYGAVYEVRVHGVPCIAKRLHDILVGRGKEERVGEKEKTDIVHRFRKECIILSGLRHPNVVQFMGVHFGRDEADISLIMEYMHMDLEQCMEAYPNIPLPYKISILRDVAYGLAYLHSIPTAIVHRDLNAGNVLLTESLRAKIADLGMSKLFDREVVMKRTRTMCPGALDFMPPESLTRSPKYGVELDIFSFGHLVIYLVNQEPPFVDETAITENNVRKKQMQVGKRRKALEQMGSQHPLYSTAVRCLSDTPEQRPSCEELVVRMEEAVKKYPLPHKNSLETLENQEELVKLLEDSQARLESRVKEMQLEFNCMLEKKETDYREHSTAQGQEIVSLNEKQEVSVHTVVQVVCCLDHGFSCILDNRINYLPFSLK